jgi:shikimate kinase
MGSGKSTVGRIVASKLDWQFVDLDEVVVREAGRAIPAIFAAEGEGGFRLREFTALQAIIAEASRESDLLPGKVVALGGGTLTCPDSGTLVRGRGGVVYLEVDAPTAWERVCGSDRPLAVDLDDFTDRLEGRRPIYESASDLRVSTQERSVEDVAEQILRFVRARSQAGK